MNWQQAGILNGLSPSHLDELTAAAVMKNYAADNLVISEGEQGAEFFIIDQGNLRVEKEGHVLVEKSVGDHFGLMAVFDQSTRSADVIAATDCTLVAFNWRHLSLNCSDMIYQQIMTNHFKELQGNIT